MGQYRFSLAFTPYVARILEIWADQEGTTIPNLVRHILNRVVSNQAIAVPPTVVSAAQYESLAHLVLHNFDELKQTRIERFRLMELRDGAPPTEVERLRIAQALGFTEEYLEALEDRPNGSTDHEDKDSAAS